MNDSLKLGTIFLFFALLAVMGLRDPSLSYATVRGAKTYVVGVGTPTNTAVLVTSSPGMLYRVDTTTVITGGYVACFDQANVTGLSVGSHMSDTDNIYTIVLSTNGLNTGTRPNLRVEDPQPEGYVFSSGLACFRSGTELLLIRYTDELPPLR